jgi:hypothetical protein
MRKICIKFSVAGDSANIPVVEAFQGVATLACVVIISTINRFAPD